MVIRGGVLDAGGVGRRSFMAAILAKVFVDNRDRKVQEPVNKPPRPDSGSRHSHEGGNPVELSACLKRSRS
ncbi:hypothetical protein ACCAA_1110004 [Candidatus Accumulibacter aalborgensis]|uniref:Uncharacterized protein n=1 Tax=Candidatus Accumulibacter aalborgensis TaxID=1860102 RepID=A0A1A8XID9_9PROT|nr:hypothetical protein ACCAA_1110004 [Candidatus Accumulibacter aalborgensis]